MSKIVKVFDTIDNIHLDDGFGSFYEYYDRLRRHIFIDVLNSELLTSEYQDKDTVMRLLRLTKYGMDDTINKVTNGANQFKFMMPECLFSDIDIYVLVQFDTPLIDMSGKPVGALTVSSEVIDTDNKDKLSKKILKQILLFSDQAVAYRDENKFHIINHEIIHAVLNIFMFRGYILSDILDFMDHDIIEFLADFLPFYRNRNSDYINDFLLYSKKWFTKDVQERYIEYMKELIPYFNAMY